MFGRIEMEMNLVDFDILSLKTMLHKEEAALARALLEGMAWEDMVEQRHTVTQLAMEVHQRLYTSSGFNPAESVKRGNYKSGIPYQEPSVPL